MEKTITTLPIKFIGTGEVKGMIFSLSYVTQNGYMYHVENNGSNHYEVFEKKSVPLCVDFENKVYSNSDYKDIYPKAKDFGVWAWTCKTFDAAKEKLSQIKNK